MKQARSAALNDSFLFDREELVQRVRRIEGLLSQIEPTAGSPIDQAISQFNEERFRITILGKAKRGKSTLINAWLGRHDDVVAPIDKLPATSVITEISWGDREQCIVHFRQSSEQEVALAQIPDYATEELNPENIKGVSRLAVRGPFANLEQDVVLADTPGAASRQASWPRRGTSLIGV